ncbi:MAG: FAD-dependent oxidoreductase [Kovacikia sp.]
MTQSSSQFDVAVIGAGMAGLACAQQLKQAGYRVVVLEKSRGVGGRMATRRFHGIFADHGTCYLTPKGDRFQAFVNQLLEAGILRVWTDLIYEMEPDAGLISPLRENRLDDRYPRYIAPNGMTAIAKFLATDLEIRLNQRAHTLELTPEHHWRLLTELTTPDSPASAPASVLVDAVVVTVPAPQAVGLLQSLPEALLPAEFMDDLRSVEFLPCLSVISGYAPEHYAAWLTQYPDLQAVTFSHHPAIAWLGVDSNKRLAPDQPVFVIQSTASFAKNYLEVTDLQAAGRLLLQHATEQMAVPWLSTPAWVQVHRWRYAFAKKPLPDTYLVAPTPIPLIVAGDWCGGMKAENAFLSGLAAAQYLDQQ